MKLLKTALAAGRLAHRVPGGPGVKAAAAAGATAYAIYNPDGAQNAYNAVCEGASYVADKALEGVTYVKDRVIEAAGAVASWAAGPQDTEGGYLDSQDVTSNLPSTSGNNHDDGEDKKVGGDVQKYHSHKRKSPTRAKGNVGKSVDTLPSEAYLTARNGGKHAGFLEQYKGKTAREIEKSIRSFDKQISSHKDKIVNPAQHYPNWDQLDPRDQHALINKKWPDEIQRFMDEKAILQDIVKQGVEN